MKNIGGPATLIRNFLRKYANANRKKDWGNQDAFISRMKTKNLVSRTSRDVKLGTVKVLMHPEDLLEIKVAEKINNEHKNALENESKGVQKLFDAASNFLVPVASVQYAAALVGLVGVGGEKKIERIVKKILAEDKVEEKFAKAKILKTLIDLKEISHELKR